MMDKDFKTKTRLSVTAFLIIMSISLSVYVAFAQTSIKDYDVTCEVTDTRYVTTYEPVWEYVKTDFKNGTIVDVPILKTTIAHVETIQDKECTESVRIGVKQVEPILQGYKCSDKTGIVICDSAVDGNADGKCQSGETCCTILNGIVTCKNGIEDTVYVKVLS